MKNAKEEKSSSVKASENLKQSSQIHKSKSSEKTTKQDCFLIEQKNESNHYLRFHVIRGKAFVEYLLEPAILSGKSASYLLLYVYFCGQRFQSHPTPATCEPEFSFDIKLFLHKNDRGNLSFDSSTLLSKNDPIHIILTKVDSDQNQFLVSSYFLEWRQILTKVGSKMSLAIELSGIGVENKVPAGMLELYLELQPSLTFPLQANIVSAQLALEHNRKTERDRLFLAYAKLWWKEYIEMRPEHTQRLVKIFAQDENAVVRPVFSYVFPLTTNRLLETPREAAWFISLFKQNLSIYTNIDRTKYEQWKNLSTFLSVKEGDYEDHSVLLCSLLLGFCLDAYVCLGTLKTDQPCSWVMTIGRRKQIIFWNSLTAARYNYTSVIKDDELNQVKYPYKTIGCIFNNNRFYANCQPTDAVELCCFDLEDSEKWKSMSPDAIKLVTTYVPTVPMIIPSSLDSMQASYDMEEQLRHFTAEFRKVQIIYSEV
ncbi:centrosomal protein of 76 kDa-like [Centruroides sculpturatus]|uniref:centrosomal protein of 76 kDa-like n=1 Tax=Centruroides sculpturatus TaxID=218467 RepID=UPI000C6CF7FB|nr:centrosomal protein of 76 kDa-like [Centruroides sculpturatus]